MKHFALRAAGDIRARLARVDFAPSRAGRVVACEGLLMQVEGLEAAVGALVEIELGDGLAIAEAEVIGFRADRLLLMALGPAHVAPGAPAWLRGRADRVRVGPALFGRVTGARGEPLDGRGPLRTLDNWPLAGRPLPALDRAEVTQALPTGVRAIDTLLTLGRGQRVGLIAGSGVGKSVLMQQLARGAEADSVVIALVGERGREIGAFLGQLPAAALARAHVVAVPADAAAPLRVRGVLRAFAIAEWLRSEGRHVLLIVDSLTRVAHAQREIGLAAGEPPGRRGYPPSALDLIPRLVERAGNDRAGGGAITALMTVLADGDDLVSDPVVDTARGVLDGHILLDRAIAGRGRFPAIDLSQSLSRTMADCADPAHLAAAARFRRELTLVEGNRDLVAMGAYSRGQDPKLDRALDRADLLESFLAQAQAERFGFADSLSALLAEWGGE
ncbi:FliI/YscN family ATPase [Sandaracinobacter sp. RS1-74]|uniref:FliI/YscN family ATPase n=1 Tax=Sandaracinobacteroides sayramensis TaxID=2913411 RepID=UPI001EDBBE17|nr:FliI/YscN family ATPase [Sandaracinobacteroides sayramensis]MCG2841962.1 FliI/YscN family ATPase [Sandaracinobacteroides sayramensis]